MPEQDPPPLPPSSSAAPPALTVRYAAACDIGQVRARNQDAAYAGPGLLVVADGFGPAGERASAAAVEALRPLDAAATPGDLLNVLSDAVTAAGDSVRAVVESAPEHGASGATLTAMLLSGSRLALVHIGDTRAYLFRDGGLFQVTHDHTVTQSMVDAGRLTPEEAESHPQRSLLLRALSAPSAWQLAQMTAEQAGAVGTWESALLEARPGDRYLLTSDGLTNVVPAPVIRQALADPADSPEAVVARLVALANEAGGPDNIVCALADIAVV